VLKSSPCTFRSVDDFGDANPRGYGKLHGRSRQPITLQNEKLRADGRSRREAVVTADALRQTNGRRTVIFLTVGSPLAMTHRQHHNYGNCNIIYNRCNPLVSLVALDEPPTHRRRYEMNLLSRRSVLAIAAVVDVALHSRSAPVAAKALAARHKLPPRHLETLLQGLVHAKILKGVRGPRGGYELARERRRITVGEIVRTAMSLSTADPDDLGSNSVLLERVIDPAVRRAGESFLANLDAITVEQMCDTAEKTHVLDDEKVSGDFAI
jgi:Rrf2 family transcriptional regulator, iron-sulfur cluster assembly transcription factor